MTGTLPDDRTCDVLVVGAGPVGLVLAADLARRGRDVRIVDALPAPTTESRAIVVHSRSLDHLEALGVLDALAAHALRAEGMVFHAGGRELASISFTGIDAQHPYSLSVPQTDTEAVVTARLAGLGVEVERAAGLTALVQDRDAVVATIADPAGATREVRARYLVGTDGARSAVRHLTGQKLEGSFHGEEFLLGDVEADHDLDRSRFHTFLSSEQGTGLLFPLLGTRDRVFAQVAPGTEPGRPVTVEWLQEELDARGMGVRIRSAHWLTRLQLKYGQVPEYRLGRVFLAGDAAHIHTPAGGLGMNTGIQDAVNLGWKLAVALDGAGGGGAQGDALLDSYAAERHPVAAQVIEFTNRLAAAGTLTHPVARHLRNLALHVGLGIPAVADRMADEVEQQRIRYRDSPVVSGGRGKVRAGDWLRLPVADVAAALATAPGHLAAAWGGASSAVGGDAVLPVSPLELARADAAALASGTGLDAGVALVRPDGYLGYVGDADGVSDYLDALRR